MGVVTIHSGHHGLLIGSNKLLSHFLGEGGGGVVFIYLNCLIKPLLIAYTITVIHISGLINQLGFI